MKYFLLFILTILYGCAIDPKYMSDEELCNAVQKYYNKGFGRGVHRIFDEIRSRSKMRLDSITQNVKYYTILSKLPCASDGYTYSEGGFDIVAQTERAAKTEKMHQLVHSELNGTIISHYVEGKNGVLHKDKVNKLLPEWAYDFSVNNDTIHKGEYFKFLLSIKKNIRYHEFYVEEKESLMIRQYLGMYNEDEDEKYYVYKIKTQSVGNHKFRCLLKLKMDNDWKEYEMFFVYTVVPPTSGSLKASAVGKQPR